MWPSVQNALPAYTKTLEGELNYMYLDSEAKVTTNIGNLIDSVPDALMVAWYHNSDNVQATPDEVSTEWYNVKNSGTAGMGGGSAASKAVTTLHLNPDGMAMLFNNRLQSNETILKGRFPNWASWPADAQFAAHSMAWMDGASFNFPNLVAKANAGDFFGAAQESHTDDTSNSGITRRNIADFVAWNNAGQVAANGSDVSVLNYPNDLAGIAYPWPTFGRDTSLPGIGNGESFAYSASTTSGSVTPPSKFKMAAGVGLAGLMTWGLYEYFKKG